MKMYETGFSNEEIGDIAGNLKNSKRAIPYFLWGVKNGSLAGKR